MSKFVGIGDETARVNALLSGGMDLVASVNPRSVARVKSTPGYAIFTTQSGQYSDLIMRKDMGPGMSPDFAQAMKYLFDREQMKKTIALDYAVLGNDQPIDPTNRFHFKDLPQRSFDLDKAKFHLHARSPSLHGARIGLCRERGKPAWPQDCGAGMQRVTPRA